MNWHPSCWSDCSVLVASLGGFLEYSFCFVAFLGLFFGFVVVVLWWLCFCQLRSFSLVERGCFATLFLVGFFSCLVGFFPVWLFWFFSRVERGFFSTILF